MRTVEGDMQGVTRALADRQAWNDPNKPFEPSLQFRGQRTDRGGMTSPVPADQLQQLLRVIQELRGFGPLPDWRLHGTVR